MLHKNIIKVAAKNLMHDQTRSKKKKYVPTLVKNGMYEECARQRRNVGSLLRRFNYAVLLTYSPANDVASRRLAY